jgi:hypothetical protein
MPPQAYFEAVTNRGYTGTFWEYLPGYFSSLPADILRIAPREFQSPMFLVPFGFSGHLWFLQYLFIISLATLPLLLYLKTEPGQRWIERLAGWTDRRGGIFLFAIPLALVLICLRFLFLGRSWADFLWYAIYFLIGYIVAANRRFTESIKRHGWVCLPLWIVGFYGGIAPIALVLGYDPTPGNELFSLTYVLFQSVWSITSWSAVVFMLSLGAKHLKLTNEVLVYANEAVLPFYLFHQTIILCVGWFVIRWNMGILPKFLVIAVVSFPLILALYQLLVKRFNVVRFLFGMRPKKQPAIEPRVRVA